MRFVGIAGLVLGLILAVKPAGAQGLPDWRISEICKADSAVDHCGLTEAVARQDLVASWQFIPSPWRQRCIANFKAPVAPSWRILSRCIDASFRLAIAGQPLEAGATTRKSAIMAFVARKAGQARLETGSGARIEAGHPGCFNPLTQLAMIFCLMGMCPQTTTANP